MWLRAAEANHSHAKYVVAYNLIAGRGVETDYERAFAWVSEAADKGIVEASFYAYVLASKFQPSVARKYLNISIDNEMPEAFWLGYLDFNRGATGNVDVKHALSLLQKAALLGVDSAMLALGNKYKVGNGVEKDLSMARHWLSLLSEQAFPLKDSFIRALDDEIAAMKKLMNMNLLAENQLVTDY